MAFIFLFFQVSLAGFVKNEKISELTWLSLNFLTDSWSVLNLLKYIYIVGQLTPYPAGSAGPVPIYFGV